MDELRSTNLIAHRGASARYLENTYPAFVCAGKDDNFFGIEADVQVTLDNQFIVYHDNNLKRLNGNKIKISETPWFLLKKYKLFDKNEPLYDIGYSICSFSQYLKICKKYKKTAVIELKASFTQKELNKLIKIIQKQHYLKNVIFISFQQKILMYLRQMLPYVPLQLLVKSPLARPLTQCVKYNWDISIHYALIKKELVSQFHNFGLKVGVWTVNNLETAKKMCDLGVDYITSDYSFSINNL